MPACSRAANVGQGLGVLELCSGVQFTAKGKGRQALSAQMGD